MYITIVTRTNTINEDVYRYYKIHETEEEWSKYYNSCEEEVNQWNFRTPGAQSFRTNEYQTYGELNIHLATISELSILTVTDFLKVITFINSIKSKQQNNKQ